MKKEFLFLIIALLYVSAASAERIKTKPSELRRDVSVYDTYPPTPGRLPIIQTAQTIPDNSIQIGTVTVGESGFTKTKNCTYEACIEAIQEEAKKMGGQFIYIVKIKEPDSWSSTCYNIVADIYRYAEK